jgi:lipoate-protein ligase A
MPVFRELQILDDPIPRSGPENMAVDEALLRSSPMNPILRIYNWESNWISFGYFQKFNEIEAQVGSGPQLIRRWTGGGIVDHRYDRTYTLIVPRGLPLARDRPSESYQTIHRAFTPTLEANGITASLADSNFAPEPNQCFAAGGGHSHLDVLVNSRKVAGAAQRRGRYGLLHQGSVQLDPWPDELLFDRFAENLAESVVRLEIDQEIEFEATQLSKERYGLESWLKRR